MIRADNRAEIVRLPWTVTGAIVGRYAVRAGRKTYEQRWTKGRIEALEATQRDEPVELLAEKRRRLWYFHNRLWWDDDGLSAEDVKALVLQRERNSGRKLASARSVMRAEQDGRPIREPIPEELRRAVFERDGGKCVRCGEAFNIQYDHILPVAKGGATSLENLQLLCADCNRRKSDLL